MKVCIISTAYNRYPMIIPSLICQSHQNWELHIIHDGQNDIYRQQVASFNDKRVIYTENIPRQANYGHPVKQKALIDIKNNIIGADSDYVVMTNEDNYFMPAYLERMMAGFRDKIVATYCSMVYNLWGYMPMDCKLEMGRIDCACVMMKKEVACDMGWRSMEFAADWRYFEDVINKYGADRWNKVNGHLVVHN
jgi:glycosyltransferase involved in cell wall biosynthesis